MAAVFGRVGTSVAAGGPAGRQVWRTLPPIQTILSQTDVRPSVPVQQRRWWYDVGASKKNRDKPAFVGTNHVYVRSQIPVVLLKTLPGIGKQGQVVNVKRGFARHHLVPKGLALLGTWENIDEYADRSLIEDPALKGRVASERGRLPFDWVDEIRLRFVRWAREDSLDVLHEPITTWDVLQELSSNYELDLLPGNLEVPQGGVSKVGSTEVPVRIAFRDAESAAGRYTIAIEAISQQSLLEEMKRKEMSQALTDSRRFSMTKKFDAQGSGGFDDDADEADIVAQEIPPGVAVIT